MDEKFNNLFKDFLNKQNIGNTTINTASILLFKEYLKRMRLWYERIDIIDRWFYIYRLDDVDILTKVPE